MYPNTKIRIIKFKMIQKRIKIEKKIFILTAYSKHLSVKIKAR